MFYLVNTRIEVVFVHYMFMLLLTLSLLYILENVWFALCFIH